MNKPRPSHLGAMLMVALAGLAAGHQVQTPIRGSSDRGPLDFGSLGRRLSRGFGGVEKYPGQHTQFRQGAWHGDGQPALGSAVYAQLNAPYEGVPTRQAFNALERRLIRASDTAKSKAEVRERFAAMREEVIDILCDRGGTIYEMKLPAVDAGGAA